MLQMTMFLCKFEIFRFPGRKGSPICWVNCLSSKPSLHVYQCMPWYGTQHEIFNRRFSIWTVRGQLCSFCYVLRILFTFFFSFYRARELISDVEKILQTRVTDSTAASGSKVSMNVAAGLAAAFKILNNGSLPGGVSLPLQSIINLRALKELTDRSNVTLSLSPSLLNSSLRLPSLVGLF